ncbi:MAG: hypothetical protein HOI23_02490 [Deltaproteobacteria bacterium]|jgi:hypothetical protein|nr:hypothetical protein [Deltaproteobacteria bacterium]MBT6435987.1 hypothetical protein [Deltaproteobacteria bacterium]MBT6489957.1 hypothetical protein [Deltaproteobacteria bacterium]
MDIEKEEGTTVTEFHRCDAPLVDDEAICTVEGVTEATGTCEQASSDPTQWNQWAQLVSAGALKTPKPD